MSEKQTQLYDQLATELVTPERYGTVALAETVATVQSEYSDLPQAAIHYFPDRTPPEDLVG